MEINKENIKELANTIRVLSAEAVQKANSGHPGLPLGAADFAAVLFAKHLRFDPTKPEWVNRDKFILSAGHGSMLLYSLLYLFGYDLSLDDLKNFRQLGSKTPGHPEFGFTVGVEATTGPLGQGFANAVGMGLSQKLLASKYSKEVFDHNIYALVSDGDIMEGITAEASSLAGHLKLDNLIYLYDDNKICLADPTDVCFTEDVGKRFESYGWYVQKIDGHDYNAVDTAIENAKLSDLPSIICCKTTIGFGSPNKAGSASSHGSPLGADELKATKENLNWTATEEFFVSENVRNFTSSIVDKNKEISSSWENAFNSWKSENKELAKTYESQANRVIPTELKSELLNTFKGKDEAATRNLSHKALQVLSKHLPQFIGGSADLEPSTKTLINDGGDVQAPEYSGKNIRFGVREHAMGSMVNGMAYTKNWLPYSATFLVFSDYMRPVMRLAALSHIQAFYIFTHDSFWVGEDGPTHQPVEHVQSLRLIPGLYVFRPADGEEVAMSYYAALNKTSSPSAFVFTRQDLPAIEKEVSAEVGVEKGAYCISGSSNNEVILLATGSELSLAVQASKKLESEGVSSKVVSMPCMELFEEQDIPYKKDLLPDTASIFTIEAGVTLGFQKYTRNKGITIGKDSYGASAPGEELAIEFGLTADSVYETVKKALS